MNTNGLVGCWLFFKTLAVGFWLLAFLGLTANGQQPKAKV